jgi:hypothetical protein
MKKTIIGLCFAVLAQQAFAADALVAPSEVRVSLELTKNSKKVWNAELLTTDGRKAPIYDKTETTYAQDCKPDGKGGFAVTPGTLSTGLVAEVMPTVLAADEVLLTVYVDFHELESMKKLTGEKGCIVEGPVTRAFNMGGQFKIKSGQAVELPSSVGTDKYVLVVRSL